MKQLKDGTLRNYMYRYKESLLLINPEEEIVTFAFIKGLNANRPESEVLKFRNQ